MDNLKTKPKPSCMTQPSHTSQWLLSVGLGVYCCRGLASQRTREYHITNGQESLPLPFSSHIQAELNQLVLRPKGAVSRPTQRTLPNTKHLPLRMLPDHRCMENVVIFNNLKMHPNKKKNLLPYLW